MKSHDIKLRFIGIILSALFFISCSETKSISNSYEKYISNIDRKCVEAIVEDEGIKLPEFDFKAEKNSQNSLGEPDGKWTVISKKI